MNIFKRCFVVAFIFVGIFGLAGSSFAMTPSLSITNTNNSSDIVQLTVNGDAYASVWLYFQKANVSYGQSGQQSQYLGGTDNSGYFSTNISISYYGVIPNSSTYVMVNGQQSSSVTWPSSSSTNNNGTLNLSQTVLNLGVGQSTTITASSNSNYNLFVSSNPNPGVANISFNGNQITVTGSNYGSTTMSICAQYTSNCASLAVNVQTQYNQQYNNNYNYGGNISLSQNSVSLSVGQSSSITINGGYTPYNMYPTAGGVFQSTIGGNTLMINGLANGTGTVNVCSSGTISNCVTLYVTVGSGSNYQNNNNYSNGITFSQSNVNLLSGQNLNVSIYGGTVGSYYIPYTSNSDIVQASINSSGGLTLLGRGSNGTAVVVVCSTNSNCGAVTVNTGSSYNNPGGGWTYCAAENQWCGFSGSQGVRYGVDGQYYYRVFTGGVSCSNSTFGDPFFGRVKQCYYGGTY